MRALRFQTSGASPAFTESDLPRPTPGSGEVLIRVRATTVTPTELLWHPTLHTKTGEPRNGPVPAHEFSGTIEALGPGAQGFIPGDEVYGMNDWFADGATAEYCLTLPAWIARKPASLSHTQAASVPISALTAHQGLFERGKLQRGETVLIHGGSGAVGVYAVQMARRAGARVLTTASARNADFLKGIGADQVIDYHGAPFETQVSGVDLVFDVVGGDTLDRSWSVLKPNGRLVTIATSSESTQDARVKQAFFIVEPRRAELEQIARDLDAGELQPIVDAVVPFAQAADAYRGWVKGRLGRGKVVVDIAT